MTLGQCKRRTLVVIGGTTYRIARFTMLGSLPVAALERVLDGPTLPVTLCTRARLATDDERDRFFLEAGGWTGRLERARASRHYEPLFCA